MRKIIIFASAIILMSCNKDKINGCITCRTSASEIKVNVMPNESWPINSLTKQEDACGDADSKRLIEKFNPNIETQLGRSYSQFELDSSDRSNIKIIQITTVCYEKENN